MSERELVPREDLSPAIADDLLIHVAEQAERRIDAVIKIKQIALKVTNAYDWMNQQDRPYLQASGSEKIANLFNISWRIGEPQYEVEPDGHFTYAYKGEFSLGGRTIEVEGTRSSKDPFFNKYDYSKEKDKAGKFPTLPPSAIDRGDVKKAALTNLYGNGITRILGIRNLTWEDLEKFAGIKKEQVQKIGYRTKEERKEIQQPQSKGHSEEPTIKDPDAPLTEPQIKAIHTLMEGQGYKTDEEKRENISLWLELKEPIKSLKDLNKGQASKVIKMLQDLKK